MDCHLRRPVRPLSVVAALVAVSLSYPTSATAVETAAEPVPTVLTLQAPDRDFIFTTAPVTARLRTVEGEPVPGATVRVQRRVDGTWKTIRKLTTSATGVARADVWVGADDAENVFRSTWVGRTSEEVEYAGATSAPEVVDGRRIGTTLTLDGPDRVVDERQATLTIRWRALDGRPVRQRVRLMRRLPGQRVWRHIKSPLVLGGRAQVTVRPRTDSRWKAVGDANRWHTRAASDVHRIDNVPPAAPVVLPSGAPRPRIDLPAQRRAVGGGVNPSVRRIPRDVWRHMVGRSWHSGCPVGRPDLRLVRLNYWGFDGYRHRGELVVHRRVTAPTVRVFRDLYEGRFPVRAMYRVDRFGWSDRLRGADDYRSMAADNTSAFNCRQVVGNPAARSPHAYGGAIDINPWENPYVSRQGVYPNSWWLSRSHRRVAWRSSSHPVVRIFARHGFSWGGGYSDFHHFED